eukprot:101600-Pelagomonas_calceolata.AAC.1
MLIANISPAANQPESQAVGQPLVTLVLTAYEVSLQAPVFPLSCPFRQLLLYITMRPILTGAESGWVRQPDCLETPSTTVLEGMV